jgi:hypothetical protein
VVAVLKGAVALVALLAGVSAGAGGGHVAAASCGKLLPPSQGMYFGAAPGYAGEDAYQPGLADGFDQLAGLKAAWTMVGQWWSDALPFPTKTVESIWEDGKVPYLRLNPYPHVIYDVSYQGEDPGPYSLQNIAAGKFDTQIRRWADAARNVGIPILAEFGTEVNNFAPWSGISNGGATTTGYGDPTYPDGPERFRDAYRHIVTLTREEGATNITWFFHVDTPYYWTDESWNSPRWYYPGDDYVDDVGLSLYAYPKVDGSGYTTFAEKLQDYHDPNVPGAYAEVTSVSSRPVVIVEVGFNRVPVSARPAWVADAASTLKSGRFSRLIGLSWWVSSGGDFDDVIDASPEFQAVFRAAFDDPFFAAKPQFTGDCRPFTPTNVRVRAGVLSWKSVSNAASYEVWRRSKRIARPDAYLTSIRVGNKSGPYRVRAVDMFGVSPFATAR